VPPPYVLLSLKSLLKAFVPMGSSGLLLRLVKMQNLLGNKNSRNFRKQNNWFAWNSNQQYFWGVWGCTDCLLSCSRVHACTQQRKVTLSTERTAKPVLRSANITEVKQTTCWLWYILLWVTWRLKHAYNGVRQALSSDLWLRNYRLFSVDLSIFYSAKLRLRAMHWETSLWFHLELRDHTPH